MRKNLLIAAFLIWSVPSQARALEYKYGSPRLLDGIIIAIGTSLMLIGVGALAGHDRAQGPKNWVYPLLWSGAGLVCSALYPLK